MQWKQHSFEILLIFLMGHGVKLLQNYWCTNHFLLESKIFFTFFHSRRGIRNLSEGQWYLSQWQTVKYSITTCTFIRASNYTARHQWLCMQMGWRPTFEGDKSSPPIPSRIEQTIIVERNRRIIFHSLSRIGYHLHFCWYKWYGMR